MKMECSSCNANDNYVPPVIGNGELSIQIDKEGLQRQQTYVGMTPAIWWAGRRYGKYPGELIPFGYFIAGEEKLLEWRQSLDVKQALIETSCHYENGEEVDTKAFVHLNHPLLAVKKKFSGSYTLTYLLAQPGDDCLIPRGMIFDAVKTSAGVDIHYRVEDFCGIISFWCDAPDPDIVIAGNRFRITVEEETEAAFYIAMVDSLDSDDLVSDMAALKQQVRLNGFDGMLASHTEAWNKYWLDSYIELSDRKQMNAYYTAQYHLRISSTRWSVPVGIFPTHWQGKYFSFDDYFSFMGLLSSGHFDAARKIPEYRFSLLNAAKDRAHRYFGQNSSGGRWAWQTVEDGSEMATPGFWIEHIFHLAHITLSAWYYYLFSGDEHFLQEKGYPVIKAAAEFYQIQAVYKISDDRYIIGKCTDLERLGPARENAFMTTCGVIATFDAAVAAAEKLHVDSSQVKEWSFLAEKLRQSLPVEDGRYVPYPKCDQKSIAVFAGTFPYHVLTKDDPCQKSAMSDYLENESEFGNMYPVGNSVCVWYAAWKGIARARMGDGAGVMSCLDQATGEVNCFSEIFEIKNPAHHPWFTTAEGAYIQMLNESLLQSDDERIIVFDCGRSDYAFKLPAVGGITVEFAMCDSVVTALKITSPVACQRIVSVPDGRSFELDFEPGQLHTLIG